MESRSRYVRLRNKETVKKWKKVMKQVNHSQTEGGRGKSKTQASFADLADLVPTVPSFFLTEATLRRTALTFFLDLIFPSCVTQATPVHSRVPRAACLPVGLGDRLRRSACVTAPTEEKKVNVKRLHTIHLSSTLSSRWFGGCTAPSPWPSPPPISCLLHTCKCTLKS